MGGNVKREGRGRLARSTPARGAGRTVADLLQRDAQDGVAEAAVHRVEPAHLQALRRGAARLRQGQAASRARRCEQAHRTAHTLFARARARPAPLRLFVCLGRCSRPRPGSSKPRAQSSALCWAVLRSEIASRRDLPHGEMQIEQCIFEIVMSQTAFSRQKKRGRPGAARSLTKDSDY